MAEISQDIKQGLQKMDPKMKETLKWSIIYTALASAVTGLAASVSFYFTSTGNVLRQWGALAGIDRGFGVGSAISTAISDLIGGAIGGLILGLVLVYFYPQIKNFQRQYLKDYLDSLYKLLFYPALVAAVISFLMRLTSPFGFSLASLISLVAPIVVYYVYAKMMASKLSKYYQ
jgi:putative effector of murein hydrolase LrgA (UPF0299 family)